MIAVLLCYEDSITDEDDPTISYLVSAWATIALTLRADFAPYLQYVMPRLLRTAALKPEMTILGDEAQEEGEWQTITVSGQRVGIRTALLDEKVRRFSDMEVSY